MNTTQRKSYPSISGSQNARTVRSYSSDCSTSRQRFSPFPGGEYFDASSCNIVARLPLLTPNRTHQSRFSSCACAKPHRKSQVTQTALKTDFILRGVWMLDVPFSPFPIGELRRAGACRQPELETRNPKLLPFPSILPSCHP